jgi:hypothetical protein
MLGAVAVAGRGKGGGFSIVMYRSMDCCVAYAAIAGCKQPAPQFPVVEYDSRRTPNDGNCERLWQSPTIDSIRVGQL